MDAGNLFKADTRASDSAAEREPVINAYKNLNYDAVNVSRDDLNVGLEGLRLIARNQGLPFVSANLVSRKTGQPLFPPYVLRSAGRLRVGIVGVLEQTKETIPGSEDWDVTDPVTAAAKAVGIAEDPM